MTNAHIAAVAAHCQGCTWTSEAANALGNAARHHDATDHEVHVEQTLIIIYGNTPAPEELGQTTFHDQGDPAT